MRKMASGHACHLRGTEEPDEGRESLNPQPCLDQSLADREAASLFRTLWPKITDDNYLSLFGFRRFRTTHLLNLRFLEKEIDDVDHQIFQAGLKLGHTPTSVDKLGLRHGKKDAHAAGNEEVVTRGLVLRIRDLIKQYGE